MAEPIILDANITPLKKQLRDATQELQIARQRFGDLSTEAVEAAKKVATIRDSISAANEQAALFDPGKRFQALTSAASLAAGAVGAVQGAMGLFGAESEETQKALLKVQSAMALSQGLSQLADLSKVTEELKSSFKGLVGTTAQKTAATASDTAAVAANSAATRSQSLATLASSAATKAATISLKVMRGALIGLGIPALILGLVALVQNFDKIKSVVLGFIPGLGQLADFFGNLVTKVTDFVGVTSQANRELEKLAKTTSRSNEDITARINLLTAQGGKEKEIFELKKKQSENELNVLRATLKTKGTLTDEEQKQFRDLKNNQLVEQAAYDKKQADELKAANEKQADEAKSAADKARANQEQVNAKKLEAQKILSDAQNSLLTEREQQAAAIEATFQEQSKKLKEAGIKDDGTLEEVRRKALAEIDKKFNDEKAEKDKAFQERLNEILTESRLAAIKDENERARAELLVQQEQKLADLATDTTLEADQKLALQKQLEIRNKQELDALDQSFAEADAIKKLDELDAQMQESETDLDMQKTLLDQKKALLDQFYADGKINREQYFEGQKEIENAEIKLTKEKYDLQIARAKEASMVLGQLSELAGKQTAAGKALGIASALTNTYVGVTEALSAKSVLPSPFDVVAKVANVATILASGLKAVKAITAVQVPGGGGGGGAVAAPNIVASAPSVGASVPTIGSSPVTALGTMMQNQPPLRAFVVESEVTNSQKRVADIERRAGF
jgi:hypothetical protein